MPIGNPALAIESRPQRALLAQTGDLWGPCSRGVSSGTKEVRLRKQWHNPSVAICNSGATAWAPDRDVLDHFPLFNVEPTTRRSVQAVPIGNPALAIESRPRRALLAQAGDLWGPCSRGVSSGTKEVRLRKQWHNPSVAICNSGATAWAPDRDVLDYFPLFNVEPTTRRSVQAVPIGNPALAIESRPQRALLAQAGDLWGPCSRGVSSGTKEVRLRKQWHNPSVAICNSGATAWAPDRDVLDHFPLFNVEPTTRRSVQAVPIGNPALAIESRPRAQRPLLAQAGDLWGPCSRGVSSGTKEVRLRKQWHNPSVAVCNSLPNAVQGFVRA